MGTSPTVATDNFSLYHVITGEMPNGNTNLGGFTVDNGLTPPSLFGFPPPPPIGDAFSINLDPNLLGIASSNGGLGTISLAFSGSGFADERYNGVEGTINATLQIRTVPEPASITLGLMGAAGAWGLSRKKRKVARDARASNGEQSTFLNVAIRLESSPLPRQVSSRFSTRP